MAVYTYICYKCNKLEVVQHRDFERPLVKCNCGNLMVKANDRNKETTQERRYPRIQYG